MKKGLLVVVALLLMSCLMAAAAYSEATINSPSALKITSTDAALLSFMPDVSGGTMDETVVVVPTGEGALQLKFQPGTGRGDAMFGLQPDSNYTWNYVFQVKNNSEQAVYFHANIANTLTQSNKVQWTLIADPQDGNPRAVILNNNVGGKDSPLAKLNSGSTARVTLGVKVLPGATAADLKGAIEFVSRSDSAMWK